MGVWWVVALGVAGCGINDQPQASQQGLFLSSVTQSVCTAESGAAPVFEVNIYRDDCTTLVEGPISVGMTELIDVNELQLGTDGSAAGLDGVWVGGDHFQSLAPGDYCVTATPTAGHPGLAPFGTTDAWGTAQNVPVEVPEGGTAETVFAFQCPGDTISALDIVVLVNEGPSITDFFYGPSGKFVLACETSELNVAWTSAQTETVTVTFEAFASLQSGYTGPGTGGAALYDHAEPVFALAGAPQETTWTPAIDAPGTYYVYVSLTNTAGQHTVFQALLHVNAPAAGVCVDDDDVVVGLLSCQGDAGVVLDPVCANALEPVPCDEICGTPAEPEHTTIYAHTVNALYEIDPLTGAATIIGNFSGAEVGTQFLDLAVSPTGQMVASSGVWFYEVDPATAAVTEPCPGITGLAMAGLTYLSDGTLLGAVGGEVWSIDLIQCAKSPILLQSPYATSGDLLEIASGHYVRTAFGDEWLDDDGLLSGDPIAGTETLVGTATGARHVFGLALSGGLVYGFTNTGGVVLIDPATAAVTPLASTGLAWTGAASAP